MKKASIPNVEVYAS